MFPKVLKVFYPRKLNEQQLVQYSFKKNLRKGTLNENIENIEFVVKGATHFRALEIMKELQEGKKKRFKQVIRAHLGDCHAVGQKPLTYLRQLISVCAHNDLLLDSKIPSDVKEKARGILKSCAGGSIGSCTESAGIPIIKKHIAKFIENRDGYSADVKNIILTTGGSNIVKNFLKLIDFEVDCKKSGIMIPVPRFPLYTAVANEYSLSTIPYYLKESDNWSLDINHLKKEIDVAKIYCNPRVIVVINPGNPTGQVFSKNNIEELVKFAYNENLVIIADEVYQSNIYDEKSKFHSFKKILNDLGDPYNQVECISMMSVSKGFTGECGLRGGYLEMINFDPTVQTLFAKLMKLEICAPSLSQVAIDAVVDPPKMGEPSYELYMKEKNEVLNALEEKAKLVYEYFNSFEGFSCNKVKGAMYAFPKINLPPGALEQAAKIKQSPDTFYCLELLNNTGIVTVPGSGFGQKPGTFHFRTTILPPTELLKTMLNIFKEFHKEFYKKYS